MPDCSQVMFAVLGVAGGLAAVCEALLYVPVSFGASL